NSAFEGGGVIGFRGFGSHGDTTALTDCTVSGNSSYIGGGVFSDFDTTTLANCTVSDNSASGVFLDGGCLRVIRGTAPVTNCTVPGHPASYGCGLPPAQRRATLNTCTMSGSSACAGGGGVFVFAPGTASMAHSTVLTNCTISGNSASGASVEGVAGFG